MNFPNSDNKINRYYPARRAQQHSKLKDRILSNRLLIETITAYIIILLQRFINLLESF